MTQKYVSVFILFLFCFYRVVCQFFCIISQSPSNLPTLRFRILIHVRESRRLLNVSKCMHTTRGGGQIRLGIYSRFFIISSQSMCVCWLSGGSAASNASARVCVWNPCLSVQWSETSRK